MKRDPKILREEYKMYLSLWRDARLLDGPQSKLARFFNRLARQVAAELKNTPATA